MLSLAMMASCHLNLHQPYHNPLPLASLLLYSCLLEQTHGSQPGVREYRVSSTVGQESPCTSLAPACHPGVGQPRRPSLLPTIPGAAPAAILLELNSTHTLWFRLNAVIHCSPVPSGKEALLCMIGNNPLHLVTRALCARYHYHRVYKQDRPAPCP